MLGALGLAGLTYGFTAWTESGTPDALVVGTLAFGVVAMVAFVVVESRASAPLLPPALFRWRPFAGTNAATLLIYAAISGLFFFLVVTLQVVAGYSPLAAGLAPLPVTVLMLLLSPRAGALSTIMGPKIPMTVGPLVCAVGAVMLSGIGPDEPYLTHVLPGILVFGLGLSATVAPLTTTALAAAPDHLAGVASGVNNAVARVAGLLAIAVLPLAAGVGSSLTDPTTLEPAHRIAMLVCAGLLAGGGVVALLTVPSSAGRGAAGRRGLRSAPVLEVPVLRVGAVPPGPRRGDPPVRRPVADQPAALRGVPAVLAGELRHVEREAGAVRRGPRGRGDRAERRAHGHLGVVVAVGEVEVEVVPERRPEGRVQPLERGRGRVLQEVRACRAGRRPSRSPSSASGGSLPLDPSPPAVAGDV